MIQQGRYGYFNAIIKPVTIAVIPVCLITLFVQKHYHTNTASSAIHSEIDRVKETGVLIKTGRTATHKHLAIKTKDSFQKLPTNTQRSITGSVLDIDKNQYHSVRIGDQEWMTENLATTRLNDGNMIPLIADTWDTTDLKTKGYCWYADNELYKNPFGALYNWSTVSSSKLCPAGWHVPSDSEWTVLTDYLAISVAGDKLKESGNQNWRSANSYATNETGFTSLPGGYRDENGRFLHSNFMGHWWSSTAIDPKRAITRSMISNGSAVYIIISQKRSALSVRCLRDK